MNNIYTGQTLLTIKLETDLDVSLASEKKILYTKPDGTKGSWTATIDGTTAIKYDVLTNDISLSGIWKLQAYVVIAGKIGYGDVVDMTIQKNIAT